MKVDFEYFRTLDFCDICGCEADSDFEITIDYGSEDPCFGCDDEFELFREHEEQHDALYGYLSQSTYRYCNECRCSENAMKVFENAARSLRVKLIKKLIEEKTLPEFLEEDKRLKELEETINKLLDKFKQNNLLDFGIIENAKLLVASVNEKERLQYGG
jgi:hypothetical protein